MEAGGRTRRDSTRGGHTANHTEVGLVVRNESGQGNKELDVQRAATRFPVVDFKSPSPRSGNREVGSGAGATGAALGPLLRYGHRARLSSWSSNQQDSIQGTGKSGVLAASSVAASQAAAVTLLQRPAHHQLPSQGRKGGGLTAGGAVAPAARVTAPAAWAEEAGGELSSPRILFSTSAFPAAVLECPSFLAV